MRFTKKHSIDEAAHGIEVQPFKAGPMAFQGTDYAPDYSTWDDIVARTTNESCRLCMETYGGMRARGPVARIVAIRHDHYIYLYQVRADRRPHPVAYTTSAIDDGIAAGYMKPYDEAYKLLVTDPELDH